MTRNRSISVTSAELLCTPLPDAPVLSAFPSFANCPVKASLDRLRPLPINPAGHGAVLSRHARREYDYYLKSGSVEHALFCGYAAMVVVWNACSGSLAYGATSVLG